MLLFSPSTCSVKSYRNIYTIILLSSLLVAIGGLLLVIASALPAYASVDGGSNTGTNISSSGGSVAVPANSSVLPLPPPQGIVNVGITSNQLAAGGPLPGNHTLALEEAECAAEENNAPWYPTVNPAELHDSNRTHVYACK